MRSARFVSHLPAPLERRDLERAAARGEGCVQLTPYMTVNCTNPLNGSRSGGVRS
jgi:hypothetical protein